MDNVLVVGPRHRGGGNHGHSGQSPCDAPAWIELNENSLSAGCATACGLLQGQRFGSGWGGDCSPGMRIALRAQRRLAAIVAPTDIATPTD